MNDTIAMPEFQPDAGFLDEQVIIISGAADGIGRSLALACAAYGAQLVLIDRNGKELDRLDDEIHDGGNKRPVLVRRDLARMDKTLYQRLHEELHGEFGRLDGLVTCAAELGTLTPLHLYNDALYQRVMTVNLQSPLLLTQVFYPLLEKASQASVIYSSSRVARTAQAYWGAYAIAGFAVQGMMQTWAAEQGPESTVRFNCVDPGNVATQLYARAYPGGRPEALKNPQDVLSPYLYLLSKKSRQVNGETLIA